MRLIVPSLRGLAVIRAGHIGWDSLCGKQVAIPEQGQVVLCQGPAATLLLRLLPCPVDTVPSEAGGMRLGSVFPCPQLMLSVWVWRVQAHARSQRTCLLCNCTRKDLSCLQGASSRDFCLKVGEDRGKSTVVTRNMVVPASRPQDRPLGPETTILCQWDAELVQWDLLEGTALG